MSPIEWIGVVLLVLVLGSIALFYLAFVVMLSIAVYGDFREARRQRRDSRKRAEFYRSALDNDWARAHRAPRGGRR